MNNKINLIVCYANNDKVELVNEFFDSVESAEKEFTAKVNREEFINEPTLTIWMIDEEGDPISKQSYNPADE